MTMQPAAGPRPIGPDWASIDPKTRRGLDAIFKVGPEPDYRFGVFLKCGAHDPGLPRFRSPEAARLMAEEGEHVRRGVVVGKNSHGRDRIEWEDAAWTG